MKRKEKKRVYSLWFLLVYKGKSLNFFYIFGPEIDLKQKNDLLPGEGG